MFAASAFVHPAVPQVTCLSVDVRTGDVRGTRVVLDIGSRLGYSHQATCGAVS